MGLSGVILKNRLKYNIENFLSDIILSVFYTNIKLSFSNCKNHTKNGDFSSTTMNMTLDKEETNGQEVIFWVFGINEDEFDQDKEFDWLSEGEYLHNIGSFEDISSSKKIVLDFMYEYLKRNVNDCFWIEGNSWVYKFEHLEKLKKISYDLHWCYKDPKSIV